jgi:hypothetical protein
MNKIEAAIWFKKQDWQYIKGVGWLCEECSPKPPKETLNEY